MKHRHAQGATALLERVATLPPQGTSARAARQMLRELATEAGRAEWVEPGELAVSEVVTNALLHAHTEMTLAMAVYDERLCVEVADQSPSIPVAKHYDEDALTGRGLGLVAALSVDCGMKSLGDAGKVIWFCIGDTTVRSPDELLDAWSLDDDDHRGIGLAPNVVLQSMPTTLWLSARQHHDALLRELNLYATGRTVDVDFTLVDAARTRISEAVARSVEGARRDHTRSDSSLVAHAVPPATEPVDLHLCVRPEEASGFMALPDALDFGERLAVEGELLMRPGLPEIIAVRDWACEQVVAQLAGAPPTPWPGTAQERFETESHPRDLPTHTSWDASAVRNSTRPVAAADDANRIVAVSAPLAELVGWDPDSLVGRRVVTLIPPRLREAHVAGFSRHLHTGESRVLGVPLEVPVLHADGSELPCRLFIERAAVDPGRTIYLAWIEPVAER